MSPLNKVFVYDFLKFLIDFVELELSELDE